MLVEELDVELPGEEGQESRTEGLLAERTGKDSRGEPPD
jgi:hypothetical protein